MLKISWTQLHCHPLSYIVTHSAISYIEHCHPLSYVVLNSATKWPTQLQLNYYSGRTIAQPPRRSHRSYSSRPRAATQAYLHRRASYSSQKTYGSRSSTTTGALGRSSATAHNKHPSYSSKPCEATQQYLHQHSSATANNEHRSYSSKPCEATQQYLHYSKPKQASYSSSEIRQP
eukprot:scaffold4425_cov161-Isochrysis_galbana.AAC.1